MSTQILNDDDFSLLLKKFNKLVADIPEIEKVKSELLEIKESATISPELNGRQREAIIARVDYYLAGEYTGQKTKHKSDIQDLKNLQETRSGKTTAK